MEESINQESITDPDAVLEIQEMNALIILSNKQKMNNICQHLQSLMILARDYKGLSNYGSNGVVEIWSKDDRQNQSDRQS